MTFGEGGEKKERKKQVGLWHVATIYAMRRAFSSALSRDGASALTSGRMYNWRVRAVYSALDKAGKADGPLCAEDLYSLGHLDQYHYGGTDACDEAAALLGLDSGSTVLDIGSGIGGTSRYLAATTGCRVVGASPACSEGGSPLTAPAHVAPTPHPGVELQPDLCEAAAALTARIPGLSDRATTPAPSLRPLAAARASAAVARP